MNGFTLPARQVNIPDRHPAKSLVTYRNPFEARCAQQLGPSYEYEPIKLTYTIEATYLPDFVDRENWHIVEAKGLFDPADRRKLLAVKKANPDYTIELWFTNPSKPINKGSKTTYADWCDKHGFTWKQGPKR